jgi:formiminotetrahydrofolate cyclodeaminase
MVARDTSVSQIVNRLEEGNPPPGGASIAALSSAMACGLVAMVCKIAARRRSLSNMADANRMLAEEAGRLAEKFLALANKDDEALKALLETWRMPRDTDDERQRRQAAIEIASRAALLPPLDIARTAIEALTLVAKATETTGNVAPSDLCTAGALLAAAGTAGLCNAAVNLSALAQEEAESFREQLDSLRSLLDRAYHPILRLTDQILVQREVHS